jgi:hypothetical protein
MARTSAADLAKALSGTDFPANSDDLLRRARENRAPQEVIETIQELPKKHEFKSMADVEHEFSQSQK